MTDALWRLIWALPLVLVTGLVAVLVLKRLLPEARADRQHRRMAVCETLTLSDQTHLHLIEVDRQPYLLVDSPGGTALQLATRDGAHRRVATAPAWALRLFRSACQ